MAWVSATGVPAMMTTISELFYDGVPIACVGFVFATKLLGSRHYASNLAEQSNEDRAQITDRQLVSRFHVSLVF